jgi:BASS family bile acid:Na+ symporter
MAVLVATITLPLLAGMGLNHAAPCFSKRWLRPVEVLSEATGALSLAYVTYAEFGAIFGMGWKPALATILVFEVCLWSGYSLAREKGSRRVIGLGTSNRNIALALLVALQSFPGLRVVSGVVGSGLLLILLGLIHVGWWRWRDHVSGTAAAASSRTVSLNQPP